MSARFTWLVNKQRPELVNSANFDVREGIVRVQAANLVGSNVVMFEVRVSTANNGAEHWAPYFNMNSQRVMLTANRTRIIELIAGTYRTIVDNTQQSPNLVVTMEEDDLGGDNLRQYNFNVNSGLADEVPLSGSLVYEDRAPRWLTQTFNEFTGQIETQVNPLSSLGGGGSLTRNDVKSVFVRDQMLVIATILETGAGQVTIAPAPSGYVTTSISLISIIGATATSNLWLSGNTPWGNPQRLYFVALDGVIVPYVGPASAVNEGHIAALGNQAFESGAKTINLFDPSMAVPTDVSIILRCVYVRVT